MTPPPPLPQNKNAFCPPPILNPFSDPRLVLWVLGSTWCTKMTGLMCTRVCRQYWRMNELLLLSGLHAHLKGKTSGPSFSVPLTLADCTSDLEKERGGPCNLQSTFFFFFFKLLQCNSSKMDYPAASFLFFYFDFQGYLFNSAFCRFKILISLNVASSCS